MLVLAVGHERETVSENNQTGPTAGQAGGVRGAPRPGSWKRIWIAGLVVVVVVGGLVVPSDVASWGPVFHWACESAGVTSSGTFFLPLAMVDSPYGGRGSVNSTYPSREVGFPPSWAAYQSDGGSESNDSVWGAFILDTANVTHLTNQTVLGPGASTHCSSEFGLEFHTVPPGSGGVGYGGEIFDVPWGPEFGTGAWSDQGEPLMYDFSTSPGNATSEFRQGFYGSNSPPISTCGGPSRSVPVAIRGLTTWVQFSWNGQYFSAPTDLPLSEVFSYYFPANLGTWQIDNLSAPGGPGGGWSFSYTPCS
jgi:hypothetical protein